MNLTARLTAAMVALVVLAVATVGILTYRKVETAVLPRGLELLGREAEDLPDLAQHGLPVPRTQAGVDDHRRL